MACGSCRRKVGALALTTFLLCGLAPWHQAKATASGPPRRVAIDTVVIHSTGGPTCDRTTGKPIWVKAGTLEANMRFIEAHPKLGIHYMIDRDGRLVKSVPEDQLAHHVFGHSERSIAIELINDGDGKDPFPAAQLDALVVLLADITQRRNIVRNGIKRHSDLDRGLMPCDKSHKRKVDPGEAFPFQQVLDRVFPTKR
jgi:N-acetylmuramoyl-L-alanine amidase